MRWKTALLALALAQSAVTGSAQEVCALPASVESPAPRRADYVNADQPVDYHALVLSWSPQYCEGARKRRGGNQDAFQCSSRNRFEWVVHGLWPQNGNASSSKHHPRHCRASNALPPALLKRHFCMMPSANLMQNEWQAHGTCGWSTPDRYFADIEKVYAGLRRPTTAAMLGASAQAAPDSLAETTAGAIKHSFLKLNPALPADSLRVKVASGSRLKEVWICLDKGLRPMACPRGGAHDKQRVRVRTPHH
ncbi:ribonuclease T2 family protein [Massilia sp. DD77]|uniref:ribonuclease T2 family protein n=1 Tax=Massilia sp. DD77 TaxID=3109349 RepID=UPI003000475F